MKYKNALLALKQLIKDNPKDALLSAFGHEAYSSYLSLLQMQIFNRYGLKLVVVKKEDYIPEKIWTADNLLWLIDNHLIGKKDVINTYYGFLKEKLKISPVNMEDYYRVYDKKNEFENLNFQEQLRFALENLDTTTITDMLEKAKERNGFEAEE